MTWRTLYEVARGDRTAAAGYYNDNVRVESAHGPVNVRIPIPNAHVMDLKIWAEDDVLSGIAPYVAHAPRLLHSSTDPPYQIHEYISGDVLNDVAPRGMAVPRHVFHDVVQLFQQLTVVPAERLPDTPVGWPADRDTVGFAFRLSDLTVSVFKRFRDEFQSLFERLRIPVEPLSSIYRVWERITPRPLCCVHSDVHRKNIILQDAMSIFLDWELALWGDPVYDMAVHLHKMSYRTSERDELVRRWLDQMPAHYTVGWQEDLSRYLAHEQIKSAIVDTVRYSQQAVGATRTVESRPQLVAKLAAKLNNAYPHWKVPEPVSPEEVDSLLTEWAATRSGH